MKILFLTPQLPFPAISGGLIKTLRMIEYLSQSHQLDVGFFLKDESAFALAHLKTFKQNLASVHVFYEKLNIERSPLAFAHSLILGVPMSLYRNRSESFKQICLEKARKCDVIFIDHFLMFQYVPDEFQKKIIFHEHNAEFLMWERFAETKENFILSRLIKFEAGRIKKYEKMILERATAVLAAPNDIGILKGIVTRQVRFEETYHLGEDHLLKEPEKHFQDSDFSLLYIGTLSWEANREGLFWFLSHVWPLVKEEVPSVKFTIIGKDSNPELFQPWKKDHNIDWLGFVEDLVPYYEKARVFVSPLNFGSGIKVKVVNALYRGIPCVTTPVGVEGLDLENGEDIMVSESPAEQAAQIVHLLKNESLWTKISRQSRRKANQVYSWDQVLNTIKRVVEQ